MKENVKILMIDNHPINAFSYQLIFREFAGHLNWEVQYAGDFVKALKLLKKNQKTPFEVILMETNLSTLNNGRVLINTFDLGNKVKILYPKVKIIVNTGINDVLLIKTILKHIEPHGFLLKKEVTPPFLVNTILNVLDNRTVFCEKVNKLISSKDNNYTEVTNLDQKILYYISIGEKMKNLPNHIPMSMSTIERRKKYLKLLFEVSNGTDRDLIYEAKERGYI
ncbi:hypothetical protein [Flavivirga jejuensis]|uniref:DNA-binding NarL/FixJ family response regulator n=1 Tax=Flavivirga jejuensis TaxID=870487 RepID=A0ABT8WUS1_9FLAO|nr:hypothetical protein [Flavivirga jejuensis]MDO5976933.1 hypothetical protein [Flavivirga jejuensis]